MAASDKAEGTPDVPTRPNHGAGAPRGLDSVALSSLDSGRYGRMFRRLPAFVADDKVLQALADSMGPYPPAPAAAGSLPEPGENPDIPAGYTYVGQFIAHDITFDPISMLGRQNDPDALVDFRTPRLDLDSMYGSGAADSPFLYDHDDSVKLLVGKNLDALHEPEDLP
ncbi:MAG TPA: hypothetical protein VF711_03150, partial [Acidimicrobiales bacterium]